MILQKQLINSRMMEKIFSIGSKELPKMYLVPASTTHYGSGKASCQILHSCPHLMKTTISMSSAKMILRSKLEQGREKKWEEEKGNLVRHEGSVWVVDNGREGPIIV